MKTNSIYALAIATIVLIGTSATPSALAQSRPQPWERTPAEIVRTLDSLAAISTGSYVHMAIGTCIGSRCEGRVSIYRPGNGSHYLYRAGAWVGMPEKPQFYVVSREMTEEQAGMVLAEARLSGVMSMVADTAALNNRAARFWLRARYGNDTLRIDGASLASATYSNKELGGGVYSRLERSLFALLHRQNAER